MERRAKIIATIGPASENEEVIRQLIHAGMDVARLNFSHGSHADHLLVYNRLRNISRKMDVPLTIMQDIQGPKIRLGSIAGGKVIVAKGDTLTLTTRPILGNKDQISVDFPGLPQAVKPGSRILIDDGKMELLVLQTKPGGEENLVSVSVVNSGELKSHKGVNLPGAELDIPALTTKDLGDLAFGLELGVDAVAVSFVRRAEGIQAVRQVFDLEPERRAPWIIAKLERPEALDDLEAILAVSDGVMVARGDLGVEMAPEAVPIAQKRIIELANRKAKIVITATQMLESMIKQPRPTRAEASDVANAIFDGTDGLMLSGETAVGSYPAQAVEMMSAIISSAEAETSSWGRWKGKPEPGECDDDTFFMTSAATELAHDRNVAALAAFTESGRTARMLSKERPVVPILACTTDENTYQRMNLYWGVEPIRVPRVKSIPEMLQAVEHAILHKRALADGQQVIFTFGYPLQKGRPTNMAYLHTIGQ